MSLVFQQQHQAAAALEMERGTGGGQHIQQRKCVNDFFHNVLVGIVQRCSLVLNPL